MIIVYNILNFALIGLKKGYTKCNKKNLSTGKGYLVFGTGAPSKLMYKNIHPLNHVKGWFYRKGVSIVYMFTNLNKGVPGKATIRTNL